MKEKLKMTRCFGNKINASISNFIFKLIYNIFKSVKKKIKNLTFKYGNSFKFNQ